MNNDFYINKISFYLLSALYLFVVFGSIYGLFVDKITILHFTLTGLSKNLLCIFGLLIVGLVSAYPVILAIYRALSNNKH